MPDDANVDVHTGSGCSCALPPGAWGAQGWHLVRYTEEMVRRQMGISLEEWRSAEKAKAAVRERAIRSYVGTPVAYEPCPAYRAACRAKLDGKVAEKTTRGKRNLYDQPKEAP